jgi:archaellum component FlaC
MAKTLTVYLAADLKKFNSGMDQAGKKAQGFAGSLKNMVGPALIGAGVAAGAFATKLAVDGVQAAIEDEKAVAQLANTLGNLNLAHDTSAVEAYIYELERAYGVADTDLRPAYERLVRSTKDTEEANRALKIAMDVAAGTGQSLKTVTDSLGRAFDGQTSTLARLGTGIDKATLSTASMDEILDQLSTNFAGAADASAATFEGRLARLTTATDNLKEAFGAGLLQALQDTNDETQDLVDSMETAESSIRVAGYNMGQILEQAAMEATELSKALGFFTDPGATISYIFEDIAIDLRGMTDAQKEAARAANNLRYELSLIPSDFERGSFAGGDFAETYNEVNFELKAANKNYQDAAARAQRLANETSSLTEQTKSYGRATGGGGASRAVEELNEKQKELLDTYELQGIAFATTTDELLTQIQVVQDAARAIDEYANAIQRDILGGIDLGQLYQDNFDEQGRQTGKSLVDGFQEQINQAEWFGNVLTAIKAQGADTSLIEQIASLGPEVGGALGQQMLNEGIVPTIQEQWAGVQETTKNLAMGLVPEFLIAGRDSASGYLDELLGRFLEEQRAFKKLGRQLGKQVGAEFKARIAKDVADAVRQVEAAAAAARAEAVAAAERRAAIQTEQAVATALSNLIANADKRSGRDVAPVLS